MSVKLSLAIFLFLQRFLQCSFAEDSFVNLGQNPLHMKAAGSTYQPRLGIISTWRGHSESWADSWLRYHISIGFSRIYLFFDDPKFDKQLIDTLSNASEYEPFLTIVKVDKEHRRRFWTLDENKKLDPEQWLLPAYGIYLNTCHTSRQIMNVARAGVMAQADDLNWLLHIDADELFWVERLKSGAAPPFFQWLHEQGITHATFFNDEVVPLTPNFDYKKRPKDPFHQRLHFKRNLLTFRDWKKNDLVQRWAKERGVQFFIGYMCGKGAINVKLWGEKIGSLIMPLDVVSFAFASRQPGNLTKINEDTSVVQPYISAKKVKIAVLTDKARILHYVNSDFESMKMKLKGRKKFNLNNYDLSIVSEKRKAMFKKWQKDWIKVEHIPNGKFYQQIWSKFVEGSRKNDYESVIGFYLKAAVAKKDRQLEEYMENGVIYKRKDVFQLLNQVGKLMNNGKVDRSRLMISLSNGEKFIHGGDGVKDEKRTFTLDKCEKKAPHFFCDVKDCCDFTTHAQFTFTKRLLGYKRYDVLQWWKPGIKWPQ